MANWSAIGALGEASKSAGTYFGVLAVEKTKAQRLAEARAEDLADADTERTQKLEDTKSLRDHQGVVRQEGIDNALAVTAAGNAEWRERELLEEQGSIRSEGRAQLREDELETETGDERVGTGLEKGADGTMYAQYITDDGRTYMLPVENGKPQDALKPLPQNAVSMEDFSATESASDDIDPKYAAVDPAMQKTAQQLGGSSVSANGNFKAPLSKTEQDRQDDSIKLINSVANMKKLLSPDEVTGESGYDPTTLGAYKDQWFVGGVTNFLVSDKGQVFQREATDASETLLRLATGAAAPEPEVERYRLLYVPEAGDSKMQVEAKMASLDNMIGVLGGLKEQFDKGNISVETYNNAVENRFLEDAEAINGVTSTNNVRANVGSSRAGNSSVAAGGSNFSDDDVDAFLKKL